MLLDVSSLKQKENAAKQEASGHKISKKSKDKVRGGLTGRFSTDVDEKFLDNLGIDSEIFSWSEPLIKDLISKHYRILEKYYHPDMQNTGNRAISFVLHESYDRLTDVMSEYRFFGDFIKEQVITRNSPISGVTKEYIQLCESSKTLNKILRGILTRSNGSYCGLSDFLDDSIIIVRERVNDVNNKFLLTSERLFNDKIKGYRIVSGNCGVELSISSRDGYHFDYHDTQKNIRIVCFLKDYDKLYKKLVSYNCSPLFLSANEASLVLEHRISLISESLEGKGVLICYEGGRDKPFYRVAALAEILKDGKVVSSYLKDVSSDLKDKVFQDDLLSQLLIDRFTVSFDDELLKQIIILRLNLLSRYLQNQSSNHDKEMKSPRVSVDSKRYHQEMISKNDAQKERLKTMCDEVVSQGDTSATLLKNYRERVLARQSFKEIPIILPELKRIDDALKILGFGQEFFLKNNCSLYELLINRDRKIFIYRQAKILLDYYKDTDEDKYLMIKNASDVIDKNNPATARMLDVYMEYIGYYRFSKPSIKLYDNPLQTLGIGTMAASMPFDVLKSFIIVHHETLIAECRKRMKNIMKLMLKPDTNIYETVRALLTIERNLMEFDKAFEEIDPRNPDKEKYLVNCINTLIINQKLIKNFYDSNNVKLSASNDTLRRRILRFLNPSCTPNHIFNLNNTSIKIQPIESYGRFITINLNNFQDFFIGSNGLVEGIRFNIKKMKIDNKFIVGAIKKEDVERCGTIRDFIDSLECSPEDNGMLLLGGKFHIPRAKYLNKFGAKIPVRYSSSMMNYINPEINNGDYLVTYTYTPEGGYFNIEGIYVK